MNRFMLKLKSTSFPDGPVETWSGANFEIEKPRPRPVGKTDRSGAPQISIGDELWLCTDDSGPGVAGRARVVDVNLLEKAIRISIGQIDKLSTPINLTSAKKAETNSRLLLQLHRYRPDEIYYIENEVFGEFHEAIIRLTGKRAEFDGVDWDEVIERLNSQQEQDAPSNQRLAFQLARPGQAAFRRSLLDIYGTRCAVTDCEVEEALEAAHVLPWTGDLDLDRPENGLLLRADIHALFDSGLLSISADSSCVILGENLEHTSYFELNQKEIIHFVEPKLLEERNRRFGMASL